jgi:DNA-directed RNA polymerase
MMVHDDYACHAADAEKLAVILRDEFVRMYSDHDPLAEYALDHPAAGPPPPMGSMDIAEVRNSPYFFN